MSARQNDFLQLGQEKLADFQVKKSKRKKKKSSNGVVGDQAVPATSGTIQGNGGADSSSQAPEDSVSIMSTPPSSVFGAEESNGQLENLAYKLKDELSAASQQAQKQESQIKQMEQQLQQANAEISTLKENNQKLSADASKKNEVINMADKFQVQMEQQENSVAMLQSQLLQQQHLNQTKDQEMQGLMSQLHQMSKQYENDTAQAGMKISEAKRQAAEMEEKFDHASQQNNDLQNKLNSVQQYAQSSAEEVQQLQLQLEVVQKQQEEQQDKLQKALKKGKQIESERKHLQELHASLTATVQQHNAMQEQKDAAIQQYQAELQQLQQESAQALKTQAAEQMSKFQTDYKKMQSQYDALYRKHTETHEQMQALNVDLETKESLVKRYKTDLHSIHTLLERTAEVADDQQKLDRFVEQEQYDLPEHLFNLIMQFKTQAKQLAAETEFTLSNQITQLQTQHQELLAAHEKVQQQNSDLDKQHSELKNNFNANHQKSQALQRDFENLVGEYRQIQTQKQNVHDQLTQLQSQHSDLHKEYTSLKNNRQSDDEYSQSLQLELESVKKDKSEVQDLVDKLRNDLDQQNLDLAQKQQEWENERKQFMQDFESIQEQLQNSKDLDSQLKEKHAKLSEHSNTIDSLQKHITELQAHHSQVKDQHQQVQHELKNTQQQLQESENSHTATLSQLQQLQNDLDQFNQVQEENKEMNDQLQQLQNTVVGLQLELEETRESNSQKLQDIESLQQECDKLRPLVDEIGSVRAGAQKTQDEIRTKLRAAIKKGKSIEEQKVSLEKEVQQLRQDMELTGTDVQEQLVAKQDECQTLTHQLEEKQTLMEQLQSHCFNLEAEIDNNKQLQQQHEAAVTQINTIQLALDKECQLRAEGDQLSAKQQEEIQAGLCKLNELQQTKDQLEQNLESQESALQQKEDNLTELLEQLRQQQTKHEEMEGELVAQRVRAEGAEQAQDSLRTELATVQAKLLQSEELSSKLEQQLERQGGSEEELQKAWKQIQDLSTTIQLHQNKVSELEIEVQKHQRHNKALLAQVEDGKDKNSVIDRLTFDLAGVQEAKSRLESEVTHFKSQINVQEERMQEREMELQELLDKEESEAAEAKEKLTLLDAELRYLKDHQTQHTESEIGFLQQEDLAHDVSILEPLVSSLVSHLNRLQTAVRHKPSPTRPNLEGKLKISQLLKPLQQIVLLDKQLPIVTSHFERLEQEQQRQADIMREEKVKLEREREELLNKLDSQAQLPVSAGQPTPSLTAASASTSARPAQNLKRRENVDIEAGFSAEEIEELRDDQKHEEFRPLVGVSFLKQAHPQVQMVAQYLDQGTMVAQRVVNKIPMVRVGVIGYVILIHLLWLLCQGTCRSHS